LYLEHPYNLAADVVAAGDVVRCTCQGTSGLVGGVPNSTFSIPDVFDAAFGWGNGSRSDCLAQFYQVQLMLTG
jgi:hypothetical protein